MAEASEVPAATADLARENQLLRRQIRDLVALMGLPALWVGRDAAAMAGIVADVLLSALPVDIVYVRVDDPAEGHLIEVAQGRSGRLPEPEKARVANAAQEAMAAGTEGGSMPEPHGSGNLTLALARLRVSDELGVVLTASRDGAFPSAYERLLLNAAANQLAFALRERQLLREESHLLETVNRVGRVLAGELNLQKLMQALTDAATDISRAQFGAFFYTVADAGGDTYKLHTLSGAPREAFASFPMPGNTAIFDPTFSGERVVRWDDVTRAPQYGHHPPFHGMPPGHLPVTSYLAVPVVSRSGEVLGGLFFGHAQPGVFTEREEKLVSSLAAQAAIAIDNARLFERGQKLYAQAQEASRLKDEFLATLSHELRTPLNAIVGWVHLLRAGGLTTDTAAHALDVISRNAEAQNQLIADMLDVSRIVTGRLRLDVRPVDLMQVVAAALDTVRPAADARGVRLTSILDPGAGEISGDPARLQQVAWNLLSNAIKFTPRGGSVAVSLEHVDSRARLSVSDTGAGIAPDFLPHVFELFRQADASSTRQHGGLGLGLAIVRHLVELHGGTVAAKSAGPGKGATFTVELPLRALVAASPEAGESHEPQDAAVSLSGLHVLVVEDETDSRELMAELLERAGAKVTAVATAAAALEVLQRTQPDLLVSDIEMPEQDGYDLIRRIRALPAAERGRIPAVALTAYAGAQDRLRALSAGFQMHVPKPVQPRELVTALVRLAETMASR
jgi:signal transduction histidine kinase/CheY-like chemotaxis protein